MKGENPLFENHPPSSRGVPLSTYIDVQILNKRKKFKRNIFKDEIMGNLQREYKVTTEAGLASFYPLGSN